RPLGKVGRLAESHEHGLVVVRPAGGHRTAIALFLNKPQGRSRAAEWYGFLTQGNSPGGLRIVAGFLRGIIQGLKKLFQLCRFGGSVLEAATHEAKAGQDAILVGGIRVRFGQNGNAVSKAHVLDTVARRGRVGLPAGVVGGEVAVEVSLVAIVVGKTSS